MQRALPKIEDHELAGATLVLGCYGGMDTFSDLELGKAIIQSDPIRNLSNPAIYSFFTSQFERKSSALSIEFVIEETGVGLSEGRELATKRMVCQQSEGRTVFSQCYG